MGLAGSTRVVAVPEKADSPLEGILNDTLRRRLFKDDPKGDGDDTRGVGGNSARDGKLDGDIGRGLLTGDVVLVALGPTVGPVGTDDDAGN